MQGVLIDTATLLDLVLHCQALKGRIRSIASSAGAAVEALVLYEQPRIDGPSFAGLVESPRTTRYLEYYCDDPAAVAGQVGDLLAFCRAIPSSRDEVVATYARAVALLDQSLAPIEDPEDIRAYDLYDYLPYHLGEDPTAIECHVTGRSVANLEDLLREFPEDLAAVFARYGEVLRDRGHPTRAAWVLPMLRMVYYEVLQHARELHYAPHATKATIRYGRPEETVRSRRFLDYCRAEVGAAHERRTREALGTIEVSIPVPPFAAAVLTRPVRWPELLERIGKLRASREAASYRAAVAALFAALERPGTAGDCTVLLGEVEAAANRWAGRASSSPNGRRIAVSVPLLEPNGRPSASRPMVLTHPLLPGC